MLPTPLLALRPTLDWVISLQASCREKEIGALDREEETSLDIKCCGILFPSLSLVLHASNPK